MPGERTYRFEVRMSDDERKAIKEFQLCERLPSEAAAVRELIRRAIVQQRDEISN
jgi:hypothetical protein